MYDISVYKDTYFRTRTNIFRRWSASTIYDSSYQRGRNVAKSKIKLMHLHPGFTFLQLVLKHKRCQREMRVSICLRKNNTLYTE